jgi:hypothetical protein
MPGEFRTYADTVAAVTGDAASPTLVELVAAADAVDTASSVGQDLTAPLARWQTAGQQLRGQLVRSLLAQVPVPDLPLLDEAQRWNANDRLEIDATFGPLSLHAHSPAITVADPRQAGSVIAIGHTPPDSFTARVDATTR